jgi:hypothetical protein
MRSEEKQSTSEINDTGHGNFGQTFAESMSYRASSRRACGHGRKLLERTSFWGENETK